MIEWDKELGSNSHLILHPDTAKALKPADMTKKKSATPGLGPRYPAMRRDAAGITRPKNVLSFLLVSDIDP